MRWINRSTWEKWGNLGGDKTAPELRYLKLKATEGHPWLARLWGACRAHLIATEMQMFTEVFFLEQCEPLNTCHSWFPAVQRKSWGKGDEGTSGKFLELAKKQIKDMDFKIFQRHGIFFGATVLGSVPPLLQ